MLRLLIIGSGLCWSVAFVVIALSCQLELYGDGAMFSYAVAVQDVWAFHWHNISGRSSVFLLTLLPAEIMVALTGRPWAGITTYGLLFYISPLIGLMLTYAADRSHGRSIFLYACCSTALLCPLVFGFPTEMWLAHAIFWPALAVSHCAKRTIVGAILVIVAQLALAFTHEGALVLLFVIVATLVPRGLRSPLFLRAMIGLILSLICLRLSPYSLRSGRAFIRWESRWWRFRSTGCTSTIPSTQAAATICVQRSCSSSLYSRQWRPCPRWPGTVFSFVRQQDCIR
jgi:hypothetical protein